MSGRDAFGRPRPNRRGFGRGLRVIAGSRRGLRLHTPEGLDTRPITDRAKESLFGHLGDDRLVDAVVLDLFAGTGAMAVEALSRGAGHAVLVERAPAALEAIGDNLVWTRFTDVARVQRSDVLTFLGGLPDPAGPFTLCFCDPPFAMPDEQVGTVLRLLATPGWLADAVDALADAVDGQPDDGAGDAGGGGDRGDGGDVPGRGAWVVVRRASASGLPPLPPGWRSTWERTFGDTFVAVVAAGPAPDATGTAATGTAATAANAETDTDDGGVRPA